jgi:hypothetical protein
MHLIIRSKALPCNLICQPDELAFATQPLDIERIGGSKLRFVRKKEHVRSPALCNRPQRNEHFLDALHRRRNGRDAKILYS